MFSKPTNPPKPTPATPGSTTGAAPAGPTPAPAPAPAASAPQTADLGPKKAPRVASLFANDITLEGGLSGDGELQVDGVVRGDIRVSRMTVGETGHVEGGIYAETAEIRGRVIGSITAKQVRLYGACYVDGDITHEPLAIESGAFFPGRSLKFQRAATAPAAAAAPPAADRPSLSPATATPTVGSGAGSDANGAASAPN